jgi:c-di-GMP-binding flagellar brake protein YcgR
VSKYEFNPDDLRRFPRFDVDCRVKIMCTRMGQRSVHFGRANNMSVGGMLLVLPTDLIEGELIDLEFSLPRLPEVVQLRAVVRHKISEYSYGLEFKNVDDAHREKIRRIHAVLDALQ